MLLIPIFSSSQDLETGCLEATSQAELNVNNVRTTILGAGDMWWDLDNAKYEIPKIPLDVDSISRRHSMFAGALWIGGLDEQGNLKVAAMTYRQDGNDFWPGPLNADISSDQYGTTDSVTCDYFDRHWSIYKSDIIMYKEYLDCVNDEDCDAEAIFSGYVVPEAILSWPGDRTNIDGTYEYLAPFTDNNNNGTYDLGIDYPEYNLEGNANCSNENTLFGDQSIWWVFNDNGNIHSESGSESAIGLEIQAQAFAFATANPINNMTFYNYKLINRSSEPLVETYFGQWVDPDLGEYQDDYVGCDVGLGLGYCYNGDSNDEGVSGYNYDSEDPPPAIGVDFFRGPLADVGDGIDNDRDGVIDEEGEQIIMSKFVYYNNDFTDHGNPEIASDYYGYLRGIWKDGQLMTYGNTGWEGSNPECNFMFPGDTDPNFTETWDETTAGNSPNDRRFLQSVGPFTLEPGAVNHITTGVVWARADASNVGPTQQGNLVSLELLKEHDQLAQELFDACFDPNVIGPELFGCIDVDALNYNAQAVYNDNSCLYEGCTDTQACNYDYSADLDLFETCEYCFHIKPKYPIVSVFSSSNSAPELLSSALGNGYSQWEGEETLITGILEKECISPGDTCVYWPSNTFLINNISMEELSLGEGNSDNNWISPIPDIDRIIPIENGQSWDIWRSNPAKFLRSQDWIRSGENKAQGFEEIYQPYADISILGQPLDPTSYITERKTPLDPNAIFEFNGTPWLVPYKLVSTDYKGHLFSAGGSWNGVNGINTTGGGLAYRLYKDECSFDPREEGTVINGGQTSGLINVDVILTPDQNMWTRCPVLDMSESELTWTGTSLPMDNNLIPNSDWPSGDNLGSWVIGEGTGEHGEEKWDLRLDLNVGKDGELDGTGAGFNSENGWGWFPGYAIDVATGQRLNVMFSENSSLGEAHNANDMIFNPTPYIFESGLGVNDFELAATTTMNGGHAVFILGTEYQGDNLEDNPHYANFSSGSEFTSWNNIRKRRVIPHIQWVGYWIASETEEWLSNPITMQARVQGDFSYPSMMNESCECSCFSDSDGDGACDDWDNCTDIYNPFQEDSDGDGIGDDCDATPISIEENTQERKIIQTIDILGRDTYKKDFYIEIYDDGSVEKKYIIKGQ